MSAIEKALLEATGAKPQKSNEDRQKYLTRLALAASKLPDDEWEELGAVEGVHAWGNAAIEADNNKEPIEDFPDAEAGDEVKDEDVEADADADDGESEKEEKVKKPAKKSAAAGKAPAAKSAKKAVNGGKPAEKAAKAAKPEKPAPKAKAVKPASMRRTLKMIVIKRPKMPVDELIEALEKKGFKSPSKLTVTSIRSDTRDTMKVLNDAGLTNIEV